ncbi:MAG: lytic transglycosylase domain-containing protein [Proteobacteria bacterium]|nr:lytic transglycosylase domain-containing protein [Pseudomonadota bacterium]
MPPILPPPSTDAARGPSASGPIKQAIAEASARSGVSFKYLVEKASMESGLVADARATTSSAAGLYQFIDSTWLDMIRTHGARYGLADLAQRIQPADGRTATAGPRVSDADSRRQILELRNDPKIAAAMAAEYTKANQSRLKEALGAEPGASELYLAHFLGPGGAIKFLGAQQENGNTAASTLLPEAAKANRGMFFAADGRSRSLNEIYAQISQRFDHVPIRAQPVQAIATAAAGVATQESARSDTVRQLVLSALIADVLGHSARLPLAAFSARPEK